MPLPPTAAAELRRSAAHPAMASSIRCADMASGGVALEIGLSLRRQGGEHEIGLQRGKHLRQGNQQLQRCRHPDPPPCCEWLPPPRPPIRAGYRQSPAISLPPAASSSRSSARDAGGAFRPKDGLRREEGLDVHPHFDHVAFFFGFGGGRNVHAFNRIRRQEFLDSSSLRNHHGPGSEQRQARV